MNEAFFHIADAIDSDWGPSRARSSYLPTGTGRPGSIAAAEEPAKRAPDPNGCVRTPRPPSRLVLLW
jgi:hypothetical protein